MDDLGCVYDFDVIELVPADVVELLLLELFLVKQLDDLYRIKDLDNLLRALVAYGGETLDVLLHNTRAYNNNRHENENGGGANYGYGIDVDTQKNKRNNELEWDFNKQEAESSEHLDFEGISEQNIG